MNLEVYQKNDLLIQVTVRDEDGVALDLTGATLLFVAGAIRKETGLGITVIDSDNGLIEIELDAVDTDMRAAYYPMELLVTDIDGNRYTALTGGFTVKTSITKG